MVRASWGHRPWLVNRLEPFGKAQGSGWLALKQKSPTRGLSIFCSFELLLS
jgi:hypothetical protein